eukprot:231788-Prorocentrum_minimum.AAC.2
MGTDVYLRREAAINALLSLIPNVRPLNYERSQFEIALTGQLHSLRLCVGKAQRYCLHVQLWTNAEIALEGRA